VNTTSDTSTWKLCASSSLSGSESSTASPAIFASPLQSLGVASGGSSVGECSAILGSSNSTSVPLIRGDPSLRSVAIVACLRISNRAWTVAANSGASSRTCCQLTMQPS